jgi:hypothetical protein
MTLGFWIVGLNVDISKKVKGNRGILAVVERNDLVWVKLSAKRTRNILVFRTVRHGGKVYRRTYLLDSYTSKSALQARRIMGDSANG